jgi:hypothetical protein
MLARLFVFVGSLVVVAPGAALIGPYFVDWTSYRADFEREASAILGRKVEVKGKADARILPFLPSASPTSWSAATTIPCLPPKVLDGCRAAPFLSGEVLIFDMRIVAESGRYRRERRHRLDGAAFDAIRSGHISLEKLTVVDGKLRVIDRAAAASIS